MYLIYVSNWSELKTKKKKTTRKIIPSSILHEVFFQIQFHAHHAR